MQLKHFAHPHHLSLDHLLSNVCQNKFQMFKCELALLAVVQIASLEKEEEAKGEMKDEGGQRQKDGTVGGKGGEEEKGGEEPGSEPADGRRAGRN